MIAICTKCGTNYNVDESKIQGGRVLLRCQVCGHWFSVSVALELSKKIDESQTEADQLGAPSAPTEVELQNQKTESEHHQPEPESEPATEIDATGTETEITIATSEIEQFAEEAKP